MEGITLLKYELFPLSVEGILVTDTTKHLFFTYLILNLQDHMLKLMHSSLSMSVFAVVPECCYLWKSLTDKEEKHVIEKKLEKGSQLNSL